MMKQTAGEVPTEGRVPIDLTPTPEDITSSQETVTPPTTGAKMDSRKVIQRFENQLYHRGKDQLDNPVPMPGKAPTAPALSGDDQLLYGQTLRPDEPITAGANRVTPGNSPIPKGLVSVLPELARMAMEPDAPDQLRLLISLLAYNAEK